jgi:hypothetical protein
MRLCSLQRCSGHFHKSFSLPRVSARDRRDSRPPCHLYRNLIGSRPRAVKFWDAFFTVVVTSRSSTSSRYSLHRSLKTYSRDPTRNNGPAAKSRPMEDCTGMRCHNSARSGATCMTYSRSDVTGTACVNRAHKTSALSVPQESAATIIFSVSALFSAALLEATKGTGDVHPIWVFYTCCDVLGHERPQSRQHKRTRCCWSRHGLWMFG